MKALLPVLSILAFTPVFSQVAPDIQWQKTYGGTLVDKVSSAQQTTDNGYIFAGSSTSSNGNLTSNHGGYDCWAVKTDSTGNIIWQKSFGGSKDDYANSIKQTPDGGYIFAGFSSSNDGDVTGHHGSTDYPDVWVVKLSSTGAIEWQKSLGGSLADRAYSLKLTADGGYIISAGTSSGDGNVTGYHPGSQGIGYPDSWIIKLSSAGTLQWQKAYGGNLTEEAYDIVQTTDGGYVFTGEASSSNGDVNADNNGQVAGWVVKIDITGNIQWQEALTNTGFSAIFKSIQQTSDGGYVTAGYVDKYLGNASGGYGGNDYWIVKLDGSGTTQWQKIFGGSADDYASSIQLSPGGGYIIAGYSTSNNIDVSGNHGSYDGWVLKLDNNGDKKWQKSLGGSNSDMFASIMLTKDDGYIIGGITQSTNGDVTSNHGQGDAWMVKLYSDTAIHSQTIAFAALPAKTLLDTDFTLTATASSGLTVSYSSSDTTVATIVSGNKVHIKATGTTNITATQAGNTAYKPATPVVQPLTITKASQTISFPYIFPRKANAGDVTFTPTSSAGLTVEYSTSDTNIAVFVSGNILHVKRAGFIQINAYQPGNSVYNPTAHYGQTGNFTGASQTLTITPAPPSGGYSFQLCDIKTVLNGQATSGLPVTYTSSDSSIVDVSGDTLFFRQAGSVTLTAVQLGSLDYSPSNTITTRVKVSGSDTTHYTPAIVVKYNPAIHNVCAGETRALTFTASVNNEGDAPFYQWKKNGVNVGANSNTYNDPAFKPGTDTVWCVLSSSLKCVTANNIESNKISIVPIPVTTPTITVISYAEQACLNRPVTFRASIKNGGANPLYQWKKNGVDVGTDSSFYVDSTLFNSDTIWCVFTTSAACTTISTPIVSNKVTEEVFFTKPNAPSPIVGLSSVTANQQRVGYSVNRVLDVTYEWVVPAGATILTGQGTNQIVVNWGSTGGQVTVRARNACGATDRSILNVTVAPAFGIVNGINENDELKTTGKAELYPNPAASVAYVSFTAPATGKYLVQLTDAQGRILQTKETNAIKGYNKLSLNVAGYAQGVYFVRLAGNSKQQSFRLVVQR